MQSAEKDNIDELSLTSADCKMLDGSEMTDLDILLSDFEDSDLDAISLRPPSPLLSGKVERGRQKSEVPSNSQAAQSGSFERSPVLKISVQSRSSKNNNLTTDVSHQQSTPSYNNEKALELRKKNLKLSPVKAPSVKEATNQIVGRKHHMDRSVITTDRGDCDPPAKRRSTSDEDQEALNSGNDDYEILSLYARDEDCVSLYTGNNLPGQVRDEREVHFETPSLNKQVPKKDKKRSEGYCNRKIVPESALVSKNVSTSGLEKQQAKPQNDLRKAIAQRNCRSTQEEQIIKIKSLLNQNTRAQTLLAAVAFCKAYMDHQIHVVNKEFCLLTRRLADMLLHYHEMRHLYRIVRLAIDMQIILSDQVLSGLIDHLGWSFETEKITVILNQIKERSIPCGEVVFSISNKYLRRSKNALPKREENNSFEKGPCTDGISKICKKDKGSEQQTIPTQQADRYSNVQAVNDARSIVRTAAGNKPAVNWNERESIYIQIPNNSEIATIRNNNIFVRRLVTVDKQQMNEDKAEPTRKEENCVSNDVTGLSSTHMNIARWSMFGKCVRQLAEAVGNLPVGNTLFSALADLLTVDANNPGNYNQDSDICAALVPFLKSALEYVEKTENKEMVLMWLSWIAVEVSRRVSLKKSYLIATLMKKMNLKLVPSAVNKKGFQNEKMIRYKIADYLIRASVAENDVSLAMFILNEYLSVDGSSDVGPVLAPRLCRTLCFVADFARNKEMFVEAAKCLSLIPPGFGDGSERLLMEQVLLGFVTSEKQYSPEEEDICKTVVEQMLARSMATDIRRVIVKAFCANVLPVFKFLEAKGVYRRPQIAVSPHLVIIPYILSVEEMALVLQRHLNELAQFLMEMQKKIRTDIPMRILLCKNVGNLRPLTPTAGKSFGAQYQEGLSRLREAIHCVLNPNLRVMNKEVHPERKEVTVNVHISSVRLWMLANTKYDEKNVVSEFSFAPQEQTHLRAASPLLQHPVLPAPPVAMNYNKMMI